MEIKGKIIALLPLESGVGKNGEWKKQLFILETEDRYAIKLALEVWNSKVDEFAMRVGDVVTAYIAPESREYNSKWYTQIKCWKMEKHSSGPVVSGQQPKAAAPPPTAEQAYGTKASDDSQDLPF